MKKWERKQQKMAVMEQKLTDKILTPGTASESKAKSSLFDFSGLNLGGGKQDSILSTIKSKGLLQVSHNKILTMFSIQHQIQI